MDNKNRPHPNLADERGLRLVRLDEPSDDERFEEPFYVHAEGSAELRQALERVKELLFKESLIGPAERARRNAGVAVVDLLSALQGRLHGRPDHEATKRIDRVAAAMSNRDSDTLATISLVQAIINESKRFDACGAMPDYSMSCPDSMEDFMSMWPERWMDLPVNEFIAAAKAWADVERGNNTGLWKLVAEAVSAARLGKRKPDALRRAVRKWEASGQIRR